MNTLILVIKVDGANPVMVDPHTVAEDLVSLYGDDPNATYQVSFAGAEWLDGFKPMLARYLADRDEAEIVELVESTMAGNAALIQLWVEEMK